MKILSIDTSSNICTIAVLEDNKILKEVHNRSEREHSETLMPMIDELLESLNLRLDDMNLITLCRYHHEMAEKQIISKKELIGIVESKY